MIVLTKERLKRGWSKSELARRASIHPSQLSQIESGRMEPYPSTLRKLAGALEWAEGREHELVAEEASEATETRIATGS